MDRMKSQSAVEYLSTYGWAILIIAIVMVAMMESGVFNQAPPQICVLNNQFTCSVVSINQNGALKVNISQVNGSAINITAIGCDTNLDDLHVTQFSPEIRLTMGSTITRNVSCYTNDTVFSGNIGSAYSGYIILEYRLVQSGFNHTLTGKLTQTVT